MKKRLYGLLLFFFTVIQVQAQITFKLKSVVGQQNPSSNGLFSYGTINNGVFQLFPYYGEDGTSNINGIAQKGWTFVLGQENYPFLAFEQLNAGEITPQPFPQFGIFMHPSQDAPAVVKLAIPNNANIVSITNNVQRPSFGCGENIGYSIMTDNSTILTRTIIPTSSYPNTYWVGSTPINAGNNIYFIIDKGDEGNNWCDDTALDVEITLKYDKIVTPTLAGSLTCQSNSATFDIAFQPSGILELYQQGNAYPIASTTISQVGNTFNGQGTFSGLDFTAGGNYYVVAKNNQQEPSDPSAIISITPCCNNVVAPVISVNSLTLCQGATGVLTATGCTNGSVTWNNGTVGTSISVTNAGTYTATCKVVATPPCSDATSTASGVVNVNALPTISINNTTCSADLLTYSIGFTSNAVTVTSSVGTVSGNSVINIPKGLEAKLTVTNAAGCSITQTVTSPNCICPTINPAVSGGNQTICQGQAIPSLTVSVGANETTDWYDAASGGTLLQSNSTTYTSPATQYPNGGVFYAEAKNTLNDCKSSSRTEVRLIINATGATPTIVATKNPLIVGETATLSISNCNGIITWSTGESTASISVKPNFTTEYSATCTSNGTCIGGLGKINLIVTSPKINIQASPNIVCMGGSTTLSMTGCPTGSNIYWTSPEYGYRTEKSPTYNGIVQAISFTGHCVTSAGESTETIGVNIRQAQDFQVTASSSTVILGESTILSADGCNGVVSWQNGQVIGNPITVWPTEQYSEYIAECLSPTACGGKGKIIIGVKPPVVKATGADVCWGATASLSPIGCTTSYYWVVWKKDDFSDAQGIENPNAYPITEPTHFRLACYSKVGESTADILIKPIALPNKPEIIPNKESYFTGETVELNVLNCNGYLVWSNSEEGKQQIRVNPNQTTTYTAVCKGGYGCTAESIIEVIVKTPTPKVKDLTICYGDTLVLQSNCPNGAGLWTDNWLDIPNRTIRKEGEKIKMFASNTYGVSCEGVAGLSDMVAFSVTVKPKIDAPMIQSNQSDGLIVKGDSLELVANGCTETNWADSKGFLFAEKTNKILVKPIATSVFSARCVVDGCHGEYSQYKVFVRPKKPLIMASPDTLCLGSSTTISAQNCEDGSVLKWLDSNSSFQTFSVSPQSDITYKAVCIGLDNLISDTTVIQIKVYQTPKAPTVTASSSIILESEKATLTASNCEGIITWNTGATGKTLIVSPTKNTTYSATCKIWNCVSEKAEILIRVRPKQLEITDGKQTGFMLNDTLCLQKQLTLSVVNSCNGTIVWNNGQSGRNITIIGVKNEVYEVYCHNADNEKSDISTATILVKDYNITDAYIYPNPTSGKLFIQSKGCIDGVMLRLYTLRGELIYEGGGHERYLDSLVLDLFNLPSEEYVLHIIGTDGSKPVTLRKRVVKTNKE